MKILFLTIFNALKTLLKKYEKDLSVKGNSEDKYHLYSSKAVEAFGKKRGMYFAGIVIRKNYVVLYFMPVYTHTKLRKKVDPELIKKLKGGSCFQFKDLDSTMAKKLEKMLKIGFDCYKKVGWL